MAWSESELKRFSKEALVSACLSLQAENLALCDTLKMAQMRLHKHTVDSASIARLLTNVSGPSPCETQMALLQIRSLDRQSLDELTRRI